MHLSGFFRQSATGVRKKEEQDHIGIVQKQLSVKLKKVYPLSLCEIRVLEVKNPLEKKEKVETPKEEEK